MLSNFDVGIKKERAREREKRRFLGTFPPCNPSLFLTYCYWTVVNKIILMRIENQFPWKVARSHQAPHLGAVTGTDNLAWK